MPLQLEIVTPEQLAYADEVDAVTLPGGEGELGVPAPPRAARIDARRRRVADPEGRRGGVRFAIVGGFLQVLPDKVVVMAETADMASEIDLEKAQEARREAERALEARSQSRRRTSPTARVALQAALLRERLAQRRHREGPRRRG